MYKPKVNLLRSKVVKYSAKEDWITINEYLQYMSTNLSTISQIKLVNMSLNECCWLQKNNYSTCISTTFVLFHQHRSLEFRPGQSGSPFQICGAGSYRLDALLAVHPTVLKHWVKVVTHPMLFMSHTKHYYWLTELRFYVSLNTKQVISKTFFLANLLAQCSTN